MPATALIEEYLRTHYRPDREYIDGDIQELIYRPTRHA